MQELARAAEPVLEEADRVLAADRAPRLARGPGGERAPVRARAGARGQLGSEQRVGVGDLEVAQDGRANRGDPPHLLGGYAARVPITAPSVSPASATISVSCTSGIESVMPSS